MPPLYKEGLSWLILLAIAAVAYLVLMFFVGPIRAMAASGLFGLAGLTPLLYRKRGETVICDERDTFIQNRANTIAFASSWLIFTAALMGFWITYFIRYGDHATISIHALPGILMGCYIAVTTVRALAIVVHYHLQNADKGE